MHSNGNGNGNGNGNDFVFCFAIVKRFNIDGIIEQLIELTKPYTANSIVGN